MSVGFDAQIKYRVEKAANDLLKDIREFATPSQQTKVDIIVRVAGQKYSSLKVSPSLEGDILVTGHEVQAKGVAL